MNKSQTIINLIEEKVYFIINDRNDISTQIKASSLEDAKKKAEKQIKSDGSYWYEDGWREVRDPKTGETLDLEKK